ncbi:hypothetical protein HYW75_03165 [Candidatus Pacearchaeota archaeon]|nr:hypothetical protein [Candidatus Pacearchaeota archaeon]
MNILEIITRAISERNVNMKGERIPINLTITGIKYYCSNDKYPVFLPQVAIEDFPRFKGELERTIKSARDFKLLSQTKITGRDTEYDYYVELMNIENRGRILTLVYTTTPIEEFSRVFLPRLAEIQAIHTTAHWKPDSIAEINFLIEEYLLKNKGRTLKSFEDSLKISDLLPEFQRYPKQYLRRDLEHYKLLLLGTLASLNKAHEITSEEFFSKLEELKIHPHFKGPERPITKYIQQKLNYHSS